MASSLLSEGNINTRLDKTQQQGAPQFVLSPKYYWDWEIKNYDMGEECCTNRTQDMQTNSGRQT